MTGGESHGPPWVPEARRAGLSRDATLARRDFLRLLAVASGALAATTGAVALGVFRKHGPSNGPARLVAPAIRPGDAVTFTYPTASDPAVAVGLADGSVAAYSAACTHLGCVVLWNGSSGHLECPCHDGSFDPRTGGVLAGPPPRPLARITLQQRSDGIYATGGGA